MHHGLEAVFGFRYGLYDEKVVQEVHFLMILLFKDVVINDSIQLHLLKPNQGDIAA